MNKVKMGQFIRKLRVERDFSQDDLSVEFEKNHMIVSKKAISDWENGKTIPSIDNLMELADLFDVTVDEILEGERRVNMDFIDKYPISESNWISKYYEKGENIFEIDQRQIIEITQTFDGLLEKRVQGELTFSEEREFRFLFEHFYNLTGYDPHGEEDGEVSNYPSFKSAVRSCLARLTGMTDEEKLFEIRKMIRPNNEIEFHFGLICDGVVYREHFYDQRFKMLDFWEKDMILACFQKEWPVTEQPDTRSAMTLKQYEESHGEDYNEEALIKNILRYLIENGACLNNRYMNYILREKKEFRIIDRVEKLYTLCKRSIVCPVIMKSSDEVCETKRYIMENTQRNRFFTDYWIKLRTHFSYSPEELYQLFVDNEELTEEMIVDMAKKNNIDTNRERKYFMADVNGLRELVSEKWNGCHEKEKEIERGNTELERLLGMLKDGARYEKETVERFVGGNNSNEIMDYCYYWNRDITREGLLNSRMDKETQELLENLDSLTLDEIREKYFRMEVIEDEEC